MKSPFFLRLVFYAACLAGGIWLWQHAKYFDDNTTQTTHAMVLKEVEALGKMELVRYNFRDVVEHQITKQWLPNAKALLVVQGEAIGCIDLTKLKTSDLAIKNDTLIVHLPSPELCSYFIDHSKSKIYNTDFAFLDEAKLVEQAYQQAEKQLKTAALESGILEQTRQNADKLLKPLLEKISQKKVLLRYPMNTKNNELYKQLR